MVATIVGDAVGAWGDGEVEGEGVAVSAVLPSSPPQAARRPAVSRRSVDKNNAGEGDGAPAGVGSWFMRSSFSFVFFAT
ncbi:MAG: hypothetical protein JSU97_07855 [Dehalococcoidia bacterium]|nr:MAG: hypothetical protein JSU97_07855 [Dehalococcoidia bacterium]